MKQPEGVRDAGCTYCGAKPGQPCTTPGERVRKLAAHDHAARYKELEALRVAWRKWERWHEGLGAGSPSSRA